MTDVTDKPISALPAAAPLSGSEEVPLVQAGGTVRGQLADVIAAAIGGITIGQLLTLLQGQLTESQLSQELGSRIDLIDGPLTLANSVAAQVAAETDARVSAITAEVTARETGDTTTLGSAQTYVGNYAYNKAAVDSAIAQAGTDLTTSFEAADATTLASAKNYTFSQSDISAAIATAVSNLTTSFQSGDATTLASAQSYTFSQSDITQAISAASSSLTTAFQGADASTLSSAENYTYAKSAIDSAIAGAVNTLTTNYQAGDAATLTTAESFTYSRSAIDGAVSSMGTSVTAAFQTADTATLASAQAYTYARADIDSAIASSSSTLAATLNGNITSAVQTQAEVQATTDGGLLAQMTWKLDVNGYVSGFGLASTAVNGTPTSTAIFRTDTFAIGSPGQSPIYAFIVQASDTTIGGEDVPAGVYMDTAFIQHGSFDTIMLANNAVTIPVSSFTPGPSGTFSSGTAASTEVGEVTITSVGQPITIQAGAVFYSGVPGGSTCNATIELWRGSTLLMSCGACTFANAAGNATQNQSYTVNLPPYRETPGAGTYTYYCKVSWGASGSGALGAFLVKNCGIVAMEVKK